MAVIRGKKGEMLVSSTACGNVTSWELNLEAELTEKTAVGDDWETHAKTISRWTATVTCWFDDSDTVQSGLIEAVRDATDDGVVADCRFEKDESDAYYTGSGLVESAVIGNPGPKGLLSVTFKLRNSSGALTKSA